MRRSQAFVAFVTLLSAVMGSLVYYFRPETTIAELSAVAMLALLAAVAETMGYVLPRAAKGSIAFIPYIGAVLVAPGWPTVAAAAVVKFLVEACSSREPIKKLFNVAQLIASLAAAILVFRALGGEAMTPGATASLLETTYSTGIPALAAFVTTFAVNALLVQSVIALSTGVPIRQAVRENIGTSIVFDVLASPIVFVFAWVYAEHGSIAALAVWAPIVGFRQLTVSNFELEQTNQELLELMVKSIEARDSYTSGHSRRVRDYAEVIARGAGLSQRDVLHVGKAALLHDVGKIHEKYAPILAKTDKLTPEEWRLMQQHPDDGAELVGTMTRLRDLIPAIRHHHEQWDGTGYPLAVKGDAIPLAARIIALADTIDAMTSERPYRRAMSADEVRREILRCRGRQFDPVLVDRLLERSVWDKLFVPSRDTTRYAGLTIVAAEPGAA